MTTIEQAICDSLADWLSNAFITDGGADVVVEPRWFEVDRPLPARAVSIILAGSRKVEFSETTPVTTVRNGDNVDVAWSVGWVEQALQLDVWATRDSHLDTLLSRLDAPLNAGMRPLGKRNPDPVGAGLTIQLTGVWEDCTATLAFAETNRIVNPGSAVEGEWRATLRGTAHARLVVRASSPRLARVLIQNLLDGVVETTETP
jgi:hypothetical protein